MRADFTGEINMITKPFVNRSFELMKDFNKSKHSNWFYKLNRKFQEILVQTWLTYMDEHKFDFEFEVWLKYYLEK